ncbi:hypothetical protein OS493_006891 [Desmophyllum pertusum]|uniref:Uncharacterized protein n=1 Tax=Desmophyllum pertusum TaxID=174260 RepID=A0A9W9ZTN3_9CNID|nr:hypothetical protein OS493_006891 [Desmophyllum pertusum]
MKFRRQQVAYLTADLPRDSKQVINARHQAQNKAHEDEFSSLLDLSKDDKAVHNLQWTLSPRVVYFVDEQVDGILQECCCPDSMSILSIDTTFNIGNFYVTTTIEVNLPTAVCASFYVVTGCVPCVDQWNESSYSNSKCPLCRTTTDYAHIL